MEILDITILKKRKKSIKARSIEEKELSIKKLKATKKKRYGNKNHNNPEKYKQTCLTKYGTTSPFANKDIINKIQDKWYSKSKEERTRIINSRKNTINAKSKQEKEIIAQKHRDAYNNKTEKEKLEINNKIYATKKKNHSLNTSNIEDKCYKILKKVYKDVIRSYKSEEYPFNCDFYIPIYIELHFHWTHGYMKYDGRNKICKKQLVEWKEKAITSNYYKNAIYTWTVRDVQKYKIARLNKLNYKVFYNIEEFDEFISTQM